MKQAGDGEDARDDSLDVAVSDEASDVCRLTLVRSVFCSGYSSCCCSRLGPF